jgi:hypothetical protein
MRPSHRSQCIRASLLVGWLIQRYQGSAYFFVRAPDHLQYDDYGTAQAWSVTGTLGQFTSTVSPFRLTTRKKKAGPGYSGPAPEESHQSCLSGTSFGAASQGLTCLSRAAARQKVQGLHFLHLHHLNVRTHRSCHHSGRASDLDCSSVSNW